MNLIITVAILISAALGGTVYVSKDAMPGDTLYGVKQTVEDIRLATSPNDPALQLEIANARLTEAEKLLNAGRKDEAQTSLNNFVSAAGKARDLLQQTNGAPNAVVIKEVEKQKAVIKVIEAQMPASAALEKTKSVSREIEIEIEIEIEHEDRLKTPRAVKTEDGSKTPESTETEDETKTPEPTKVKTPEPTKVKTPEPTKVKTLEPTKVKTLEPTKVKTLESTKVRTPEPTETRKPEATPKPAETEKPDDKKSEEEKKSNSGDD